MLRVLYVSGNYDASFTIPQDKLGLTVIEFQQDSLIASLKAGRLVTVDSNGDVALADKGTRALGVLNLDAAGYAFENVPALASGKVTVIINGSVIETDEVVEDNIAPGDALYVGDDGQFTKTQPFSDSAIVGYARSANSAADKTTRIQVIV
jgi:hypothetical protein